MIFLELDWAIYQRLTGAPLDAKGRPQLDPTSRIPLNSSRILPPEFGGGRGPSYGIRIPDLKHPHDFAHGLTQHDPAAMKLFGGYSTDTWRQVPVFSENMENRKWVDVWPCVTFRWNGLVPDTTVSIYNDPFIVDDSTANTITISNRNGDVLDTGKAARFERPNPDSYKVQYVITAQAKSNIEIGLICAEILHLFPLRTALDVTWASGEVHPCDISLESHVVLDNLGDDNVPSIGEEQRFFKRAFIYQVEAYYDNTTNSYNTQHIYNNRTLIYKRILEIMDIQSRAALRWELNATDLGE